MPYSKGIPRYNTSCPDHPRKIYETHTGWSFGIHENLKEPKYVYVIAFTKIADPTNSKTTTLNALPRKIVQRCSHARRLHRSLPE
ncbi:hypothetical protein M8C21_006081 [Ambrosia artemisiifolia]|uniref:Uncharacterized protein n=1 Tax=Ambrosia artemisiifolia TaxID=4212 RepID=A0AAD5BTN8_AMBAR|nr:hypothetical protein M8C21_006081 [Ambrosia artemisiifolia]